jgi:hypothetical protein
MESFTYFLLGIVASVLINLATPYIQNRLEGTILVNKGKRLKALKEEFELNSDLYANASKFTATITGDLIFLISLIMLVIVLGFLAIFVQAVAIQMPDFDYFKFMGYTASTKDTLQQLAFSFHQASWIPLFLAFLILGVFFTLVIRVSNKIKKVKNYGQYKKIMEERIKTLELSK